MTINAELLKAEVYAIRKQIGERYEAVVIMIMLVNEALLQSATGVHFIERELYKIIIRKVHPTIKGWMTTNELLYNALTGIPLARAIAKLEDDLVQDSVNKTVDSETTTADNSLRSPGTSGTPAGYAMGDDPNKRWCEICKSVTHINEDCWVHEHNAHKRPEWYDPAVAKTGGYNKPSGKGKGKGKGKAGGRGKGGGRGGR